MPIFILVMQTTTHISLTYSGWALSGLPADEGAPLPKISHTYPTMIKLVTVIPYLKKIQKTFISHDTPLEFC